MRWSAFVVTLLVFAPCASANVVGAQGRTLLTQVWKVEGGGAGAGGVWYADVALDARTGHLWVLDDASDSLRLWQKPDGPMDPPPPTVLESIGFRGPVRLAWAPDGLLRILDVLEHAVYSVSSSGSIAGKTALSGPKLRFPKDFLVSDEGHLIVLGATGDRPTGVRVYSPSGALLAQGASASRTGEPRVDPMVAGGVGAIVGDRLIFSRAQSPELLSMSVPGLEIIARLNPPHAFPSTGREFMTRTDGPNGPQFSFDWFFTRPSGLLRLGQDHLLHVTTDFRGGSSIWSIGAIEGEGVSWRTWTVDRPLQPLEVSGTLVLAMERDPASGQQSLVAFILEWDGSENDP